MSFRADLHVHSTFSDGLNTPEELVALAKKVDLQGIALTDHDSFEGWSEMKALCEKNNLLTIPGAEFSSHFQEFSIHILAYSFSPRSKQLLSLVAEHKTRRKERILKILDKLKKQGITLSFEELKGEGSGTTLGRPHVADALIKKQIVGSREEAFAKFLGEKGKSFIPTQTVSLEKTIDIIHEAGGFALLAHPHLLNISRDGLKKLLSFPFDGIEAYYNKMSRQQCQKWLTEAETKNWLISGGSDYHGGEGLKSNLGSSWTREESFLIFKERALSNQERLD